MCDIGDISVFKKMEAYIENVQKFTCEECFVHIVLNVHDSLRVEDKDYLFHKYEHETNVELNVQNVLEGHNESFVNFLKKYKKEKNHYDYIVKLHTDISDNAIEALVRPLLGSTNRIKYIIDLFTNQDVGLVGSTEGMYSSLDDNDNAIRDYNHLSDLAKKRSLPLSSKQIDQFVHESIFWMRIDILDKYLFGRKFETIVSGREASATKAYNMIFSFMAEDSRHQQVFLPEVSLVQQYQISPVPIIFPQFHEIPENNAFWGEGFTEWTLLRKNETNNLGLELQKPHPDIGYYNILDDNYLSTCEQTFANYLISTVCYYHYWFKGHKVMYKPLEKLRDENKPDVNFSLIWANETWTSRWDGGNENVLINQEYGDETFWQEHLDYLLTFFKHKNYVKINNKPVFMIYRPLGMGFSLFSRMIAFFNDSAKLHGFDGLYTIIFYNNTSDLNEYEKFRKSPLVNGVLDFNPNYVNTTSWTTYMEERYFVSVFPEGVYDESIYLSYNPDVQAAVNNGSLKSGRDHYLQTSETERKMRCCRTYVGNLEKCYKRIENEPKKHDVQLYSTITGWDNSVRRPLHVDGSRATIFVGGSPDLFRQHLKNMIEKIIRNPNKDTVNYLVINAFNEFNEGTMLEPTVQNGYRFLEAVRTVFSEYY